MVALVRLYLTRLLIAGHELVWVIARQNQVFYFQLLLIEHVLKIIDLSLINHFVLLLLVLKFLNLIITQFNQVFLLTNLQIFFYHLINHFQEYCEHLLHDIFEVLETRVRFACF